MTRGEEFLGRELNEAVLVFLWGKRRRGEEVSDAELEMLFLWDIENRGLDAEELELKQEMTRQKAVFRHGACSIGYFHRKVYMDQAEDFCVPCVANETLLRLNAMKDRQPTGLSLFFKSVAAEVRVEPFVVADAWVDMCAAMDEWLEEPHTCHKQIH